MEDGLSPQDVATPAESKVAELSPEQKKAVDGALVRLGEAEYTVDLLHRNKGLDSEKIQSTLNDVVPQIEQMGRTVIPYLVEKIQHPSEADTAPALRDRIHGAQFIQAEPHIKYTDLTHRTYPALFIDGHADIRDMEHVLNALETDTILHSNSPEAATILLDTTKRLAFPVRELVEEGKAPPDNQFLTQISDRLITMYESRKPDQAYHHAEIQQELLKTLALVGTPKAREFVNAHREEFSGDDASQAAARMAQEFDASSWNKLVKYDFSPKLDFSASHRVYRLGRDFVDENQHNTLVTQAREVVGLRAQESNKQPQETTHVDEPMPVEDKAEKEAEIAAVQNELQTFDADTHEEMVRPAVQVVEPIQPKEFDKGTGLQKQTDRRGFLRFLGGAVGLAAGLKAADLAEGEKRERPIPASVDPDATGPELAPDDAQAVAYYPEPSAGGEQVGESRGETPPAPVPSEPPSSELVDKPIPHGEMEKSGFPAPEDQTGDGISAQEPTPPSEFVQKEVPAEDAPSPSPELTAQEPEEPEVIQGVPGELPPPPGGEDAPLGEVIETSPEPALPTDPTPGGERNGVSQSELPPEANVQNPIDAGEIRRDSRTVTVGITAEGPVPLSQTVWEGAGENIQYWEDTYWNRPENLGALLVMNHEVLKKSYEERVNDIPENMRYVNGYPSQAEIIRLVDASMRELQKIGRSAPTSENIKWLDENQAVLDQITPLRELRNVGQWVREGDKFNVPNVNTSRLVLQQFRNRPSS